MQPIRYPGFASHLNLVYWSRLHRVVSTGKDSSIAQPPKRFLQFSKDHPRVASAYDQLGNAVHNAAPLDEKTRALVKIRISTGARLEGAVQSHVRKALEAGATPDEIRHAVLTCLADHRSSVNDCCVKLGGRHTKQNAHFSYEKEINGPGLRDD